MCLYCKKISLSRCSQGNNAKMFSGWHIGRSQKKNFLCEVYNASKESGIDRGWTKATLSFLQGKKNNCIGRGNTKM